ncbi:MAG: BtrH N-terminal domain-containing protein [Candidatus Methanofastidiosia archaeon]
MERIILDNFKYFGGKHCQTTALRNILRYYGIDMSEELLLGLGGGLGFIYWYMKQMPAPFVGGRSGGRNEEFMTKMMERMGGKGSLFETGSIKRGHGHLMEVLRRGEPVYTYVDMAYLPYLALPGDAHFGAHTIVVYGVDEQEDSVHVSDRGNGPFTVSVEDLTNARNSKFPPFQPKNKILEIEVPEQPIDVKEGIVEAIKECCYTMQNPPITNFGLAGIKKWAKIIPDWPKQFQGLNLYGCLMNVYIYIEIGGSGGSAFRPMYAEFLREASQIIGNPELESVADLFEESGRMWSEVAEAALPDSWPTLGKARKLMYEKNEVFEQQKTGAFERMIRINAELDDLMKKAARELEEEDVSPLLRDLQQKVMNLYESETRAISALAQAVS